jgi:hypothetical protein
LCIPHKSAVHHNFNSLKWSPKTGRSFFYLLFDNSKLDLLCGSRWGNLNSYKRLKPRLILYNLVYPGFGSYRI